MKKIWACLLCLTMLCGLWSASADAATLFPADLVEDTNYLAPSGMIALGDTLWTLLDASGGAYLAWWRPDMPSGQAAKTPLVMGRYLFAGEEITEENRYAVSYLFTDGEKVMSLNPASGLVFAMEVTDGEVAFTDVVTLGDVSPLFRSEEEYAYLLNVADVFCMDNTLYWVTRDWNDRGDAQNQIVAYDLTDGSHRLIEAEHVIAAAPYRDGKLLIVIHDEKNAFDEKTNTLRNPYLGVLDPATGEVQQVSQFPYFSVDSVIWCEALDAAIYFENSRIMGLEGLTEPRQYGYLPMNWVDAAAIVDGTTLVAGSYDGTMACQLSGTFATDEYLNIYNSYLDDGTQLFAQRYPQVPVYFATDYYDDVEKLNQAMIAGEDALDLLQMNVSNSSFLTLMEKGYCADLSGDAELMAMAERLHPVFRDAVMKDGKLYAIPVNAYSFGWACNPGVLEELGMTAEEMPTDLIALCEMITEWNDGLMDDYPEYCLIEGVTNTREWMFNRMVDSYLEWCQAQGTEITFNTPLFRQLMAALEDMRCDEMDRVYSQDEQTGEMYRQGLLMWGYSIVGDFSWMMEGYNDWMEIIPMKLTAETDFFTAVNMEVMFLNPRSAHKDMAIELLKCRIEGMQEDQRHVLFADAVEPWENPYYRQAMDEYQANLDELNAMLLTAAEDEKAFITQSIAECLQMMSQQEQYRWNISEEAIARYQAEVVPAILVASPSPFNSEQGAGGGELSSLMKRYRDGQIDVEQFIREADNKLWMMRMENQ